AAGGGIDGAERVLVEVARERTDVAALVAADRVDAARVEALEDRDVVAAAHRIGRAEAKPERAEEAVHERLVPASLRRQPQKAELAAEEAADRLDGGA